MRNERSKLKNTGGSQTNILWIYCTVLPKTIPLRHHYIGNIEYIFKNVKYFHHTEYSSPMCTKSF
jgi:hypothetical protein